MTFVLGLSRSRTGASCNLVLVLDAAKNLGSFLYLKAWHKSAISLLSSRVFIFASWCNSRVLVPGGSLRLVRSALFCNLCILFRESLLVVSYNMLPYSR